MVKRVLSRLTLTDLGLELKSSDVVTTRLVPCEARQGNMSLRHTPGHKADWLQAQLTEAQG